MEDQATLIIVGTVVALGVLLVIGLIIARLYRRASKEVALVRTGMGGEKVVRDGGALVFPVLHEMIQVNMNTLKLEVNRSREQALITQDRMRVDVQAEFYVRVKPDLEAISTAAQTLGRRTMEPQLLKELVEGKFVDALRAVAAGMSMEQLHENRMDFAAKVQNAVSEDLHKNGLELEAVSLTGLDQTPSEFFNPQNAFDAQGLTRLTQQIEQRRRERNDIERSTQIEIERKDLETQQQSLQISRDNEYAKLTQEQEVRTRRAETEAIATREEAERRREAEQARIESERAIEDAEIEKRRQLEEREIQRKRAIEIATQEQQIAVAEKSRDESAARAAADQARADAVKAEEQVITVRETAAAERAKEVRLVQARENAEQDAIGIRIAAEAEKQAATDRAEAVRLAAEGDAAAVKIRASADQERFRVDAEGQLAINEARNALSPEQVALEIKLKLLENLPAIIEQSVKPMEQIDGIKIIDVRGLSGQGSSGSGSGSGNDGGNGSGGDTNLARSVVDQALRYRAQAPLLDSLMNSIGINDLADLQGLVANPSDSTKPESHTADDADTKTAPVAKEKKAKEAKPKPAASDE